MRKSLVILACSTMLLTACSSKKADDPKPVVEQTTQAPAASDNTDTAPTEEAKTNDTSTNKEESNAPKTDEAPATDDKTAASTTDDSNSSNDITGQVVEFIMNGQQDKPAADQLLWSKTFLDKLNLNDLYQQYLTSGGTEGDVEKFASYITDNAPIADDWQDMFKEDLKATYGVEVTKLEDLGDNQYQAYIMNEGSEVPYVVVNARTGYFHG